MSKPKKPTESELEILNTLWDNGPSTVRTVHERLGKDAGYTTTLKLMQIMHEKGLLQRDTSSKMHVYKAAVNRDQAQGQALQRVIDTVFSGSAMSLVMQALGNHKVSTEELKQIREFLDKAAQNKQ